MEYLFIFLEGIASFISPCLLPMIPIYISYFIGENDEHIPLNNLQIKNSSYSGLRNYSTSIIKITNTAIREITTDISIAIAPPRFDEIESIAVASSSPVF